MELLESANFWILAAFLLFIGLVVKKGYRKVVTILDERASKIEAELDQARQLREEAQELLSGYQKKQREAAKETEAILEFAKEETERKKELAKRELETFAARRTEQAGQAIAQAEAQATKEVRDAAIEAALGATARLIRENLDERRADALLDEAVAELSKKLH
jgi:F-type H+-transporting ATPase subunit b